MEVLVKAKENSTTGGVGQVAGTYGRNTLIIINTGVEDLWSIGTNLSCNATGLASSINPNWSMNNGTLVGSIDGGKSFFPVALQCEFMVTSDNTTLTFYCLDTNKDDNSGEILAHIMAFNLA